ncbi:hypothetical protein [Actinomadura sp. DC4]|uniref:hypothetical protein n=1 Tax=Actinomadura sp. DC4 TaxID=3055069 RepID=UPI0025B089DC|nr:hypothetical protein [Actinomadura sp. DC4]MDN3354627.1 hypothetical protein [Actinomadura sp. DC4]
MTDPLQKDLLLGAGERPIPLDGVAYDRWDEAHIDLQAIECVEIVSALSGATDVEAKLAELADATFRMDRVSSHDSEQGSRNCLASALKEERKKLLMDTTTVRDLQVTVGNPTSVAVMDPILKLFAKAVKSRIAFFDINANKRLHRFREESLGVQV